MLTDTTKATLERIKVRTKELKEDAIAKLIDAAPTKIEALKLALESQKYGYERTPTYKGEELPLFAKAEDDESFVLVRGYVGGRRGWDKSKQLSAKVWLEGGIWLTGYEVDNFTPYKRMKLEQWAKQKDIRISNTILCSEVPVSDYVDPNTIYDWEEVNAQKIKRKNTKRGDGRPTGAYEGYVDNVYTPTILAADIDTTKPVLFVCKGWNVSRTVVNYGYDETYTLVVMGQNRVNKFKRDFPMAKQLQEAQKELAENWKKNLSHADVVWIQILQSGSKDSLKLYDPTLVDDPALREAIVQADTLNQKLHQDYDIYGNYVEFPVWENPLNKYPLLTEAGRYDIMKSNFKDHAYLYFNAAYAANQEDSLV